MVKKESIQKSLQKIWLLCVQLIYEVEKGDVIEVKELLFVVGVVGDLVGQFEIEQLKLCDCKFVNIDCDNFDDVMKVIELCVVFQVENCLSLEGGKFVVDLKFCLLLDFSLDEVVEQVELLCCLFEVCLKFVDLCNKFVGNDKFEDLLFEVLKNMQ